MKTLIEFLSLRPIWTRRGFEVVWCTYVAATLINLWFRGSFLYSAVGTGGNFHWSLALKAVSILFALAHLALVRIFLEIALKFLINTQSEIPLV